MGCYGLATTLSIHIKNNSIHFKVGEIEFVTNSFFPIPIKDVDCILVTIDQPSLVDLTVQFLNRLLSKPHSVESLKVHAPFGFYLSKLQVGGVRNGEFNNINFHQSLLDQDFDHLVLESCQVGTKMMNYEMTKLDVFRYVLLIDDDMAIST